MTFAIPLIAGRSLRAEDEVRTRDLQLGRLSLYQLSYFRITKSKIWKIEKLEMHPFTTSCNPIFLYKEHFIWKFYFQFFKFPIFQTARRAGLWARMDSNHRTPKRTDLQSVVVGHLTTCPDSIHFLPGKNVSIPESVSA